VLNSDTGVHVAAPKFLRLMMEEGFSTLEIQMLGLLTTNPAVPDTHVSKKKMERLQKRVNPPDARRLCDDKLLFYRRCSENALATPRVYAAVSLDDFETYGVPRVDSPAALLKLFQNEGPCEFVLKPVAGSHGEGVTTFKFDGKSSYTNAGGKMSAEDIFAYISRWAFRKWFLQERIFPHPDLIRLADSQSLQTSRVVTCLSDKDEPSIAIAYLRIIGGNELFDNFNFGTSGNLLATLDIQRGRCKYVFGPVTSGPGICVHTQHPKTGILFETFTVPFMAEVCDLALRASHAFKPLKTVGWDVAITPTGSTLIEGNSRWDPLPTLENLRAVAASLR
jgi:hypothetical protein